MKRSALLIGASLTLGLAACSHPTISPATQYGASPKLPDPVQYLFPPMGIANPVGWKNGAMPVVPAGFTIAPFATGMKSPRNVLALPNGDVLVVESGGPGIEPVTRPKDIIFGIVIGKAHGPGEPGNEIVLLRDTDGDGRADMRKVLADKLDSPFGIVASGGYLYVAETGRILRYAYTPGQTSLAAPAELTDLPKGEIDHHWTKSLTASPDGSRLYVGVGSNSNITENGLDAEAGRAAIWEVHPEDGAKRLYATGLRNPNGLTFNPETGQLWCVVNERDELGNDLVPDYMTSVKEGAFYGWPWSYYGNHVDVRVMPRRADMVAKAIAPDYSLSSHVAPLGLVFDTGSAFPSAYHGGAFIGEHGSWDRTVPNGYQVAFVPFTGGKPSGKAQTFVGGFIDKDGGTQGRPVGVAFDASGALLVADDVGNVVWRVTANTTAAPKAAKAPA
ncbi:MAG: sorbosone dehydrogenase family protein [Croceibacterium sp.]